MITKKIGVLGSGIVSQVLAHGFLTHGYEVVIGTSNPDKLADWQTKNNFRAKVVSFEEAAKAADIIVLAVKGHAAEDVLKMAGISHLSHKTVIDCTNPIDEKNPPENGVLHFYTNLNSSLMEQLQKAAPKANFVKAFNSVGSAFMVNPDFSGITPTMFICGNNEDAKKQVKHILDQFGWEIEDMGKAEAARAIEPLCMLWCIQGILHGKWSHAFKLLKK
ncbi:MAG TPA: NAD(P)-binding domain-containing protein [Bacteroidia bacterium]|nr:NAD(P)-binding domain-containing protein [Bacteroidia bacterium]